MQTTIVEGIGRNIQASSAVAELCKATDLNLPHIALDDEELIALACVLNMQIQKRFSRDAKEEQFIYGLCVAIDKVADGLQTAFEVAADIDEAERKSLDRAVTGGR